MDERKDGMAEMELEADGQVYDEFCDLCQRRGLVPEEVTRQFFRWVAACPDEAAGWLRQAAEEQGIHLDVKDPVAPGEEETEGNVQLGHFGKGVRP